MNKYAWLDGNIVASKKAKTPFCELGFLYGQGLFETMRSYNGKVFLLDRHINRLIQSCPVVGIKPPDKKLLERAVLEIVKKNQLSSGYIRLNVWKKEKDSGIYVFTKKMSFHSGKDYSQGFSAIILKDIRQNEFSPLVKVKSLNHYFYILLGEMASKLGADEGVILNTKGEVCEGTRSNIFVIIDNTLLTPLVDCGCLPGVTRQAVIEIAKHIRIKVKETKINPSHLFSCKEAFLTNSLIEIMPLTKIDGKTISTGKIGKITKRILEMYRDMIVARCSSLKSPPST